MSIDFKSPIGALWNKQSSRGQDFFAGEITVNDAKVRIAIWSNRKRPGKNDPDWRIFVDDFVPNPAARNGAPPPADDWDT